jgi:creatinine amidohydrolase
VDVDHVPLIQELDQFLDYLANYPANSSKETLRSMASTVPPRDWTEIRWPDIARPDAARWIAVLPLAATEQHGPHLPLETDVLIGEAYLARVRELLPAALPVTFLPLQPVGISTEHIDYPGTLTLPTDVALKEWMAIGEGVAQAGIRKLVIVTSHGGNSAAMSLVAQDLRAHHGLLVVTTSWSRFGAPDGLFSAEEIRHGIHGGAVETSIMLARWICAKFLTCAWANSMSLRSCTERPSTQASISA